MSKSKIFAIHDSKVEAYLTPFFMRTKAEAIRGFATLANDTQTNIGKHPADYTLIELAEWDQLTGEIKPHEIKQNLGTALEHKASGQGE